MDAPSQPSTEPRPVAIELERARGLHIRWSDGLARVVPVQVLRRHSPSADQRELRAELARNPLAVLPASATSSGPLTAEAVEPIGHYALRIRFSDGHDTGLYTWRTLRELCERHGIPASDPPSGTT